MESALSAISGFITDLGPSVVLPVLITLFGLALRMSLSKAFRAGLTIGVGFIGINLVIGLLSGQVAPAATAMADRFGVSLNYVDVGWPSSAAIAFGSTVGAVIIPLGLVVNILLLVTGMTRTLDIDLWNYWHSALIGALVTAVTGYMARPGRGLRVPSALPGRHCHPDGGAAAVAVLEIPVRAEHRLQNRRARGTQSHHPHAHHLHRAHVHLPVPVERTHPRPVTPSSPRLGL